MDIRMRFAQNLRNCLKAKGKIQDDVIADLGYSSSTVSQWCTGKTMPRPSRIQRLADYLGVSVDALYAGESEIYTEEILKDPDKDVAGIINDLRNAGVKSIKLEI